MASVRDFWEDETGNGRTRKHKGGHTLFMLNAVVFIFSKHLCGTSLLSQTL